MFERLASAMPTSQWKLPSHKTWRIFLLICIASLTIHTPLRELLLQTLVDAYLGVSIFVFGTLAILLGLEKISGESFDDFLTKYKKYNVLIAAFLGATPGCGGAIVVMTNYSYGKLSFGSVVAVLTATMGDAAFLLIAREPLTGLFIILMGFAVGLISGLVIDKTHGTDFMRPPPNSPPSAKSKRDEQHLWKRPIVLVWLALTIPSIFFGITRALQIDISTIAPHLSGIDEKIAITVATLSLIMWTIKPKTYCKTCFPPTRAPYLIEETNFITAWVIFAFLAFELFIFLTGLDLAHMFHVIAPLVPLIAIAVGFIPGCGPQIVVTTLYLNDIIPLSAQIGNSISNDGDALFPALAIAPKAALLATAYSAVPALIFSYAYFFLFE